MGNAKAKEAMNYTVADRNDGEECNEARDDHGRSGEGDDSKLGRTCLSEQSKTISFNVLLLCTAQNSTTTKSSRTFTARKVPESVAALKLAIQEELHVPVYDQKLSFGSTVMADVESLDFYRLKDGDQITLEYTTTVDVECALHLMSLLRNALEFVKNAQSQLASGRIISPEFSKQISDTLHVEGIIQCYDQLGYLGTADDKLALANFTFILNNGGLDLITSLHSLLLKQTWDQICHLDLQHLERQVLFLVKALYSSVLPYHLRSKLINYLNNIFGSFLRVPILSEKIAIPHNPNLPASTRPQQLQILVDVLFAAVLCLVSISKDEQHQVQIVENEKVMKQLIGFLTIGRLPTLCCLENLLYNSYTHKHLSNVDLIVALMKIAERPSSQPVMFEDMDPALCSKLDSDVAKYFVVMIISHLALTKAVLLPKQLIPQMEFFVNHFLSSLDFSLFYIWMRKANGFIWHDLFTPLRLAYSQLRYTSICRIDSLCFEAVIISLQMLLNNDDERQILIKQGLLDYLICLPWHISEGLEAHKRAKLLLEMVGCNIPLQPPSLNNIVRAKLAAMWCGLEKAMSSQLVSFCLDTALKQHKRTV
eukprot:Em0002g1653a